jgi:hypothetical protein
MYVDETKLRQKFKGEKRVESNNSNKDKSKRQTNKKLLLRSTVYTTERENKHKHSPITHNISYIDI